MGNREILHIEVAYARTERQCVVALEVPVGITVAESVRLSGLAANFPEADVANCKLGICGRLAAPDQPVNDGDRVEIYRPLCTDPKTARRERARSGSRPPG